MSMSPWLRPVLALALAALTACAPGLQTPPAVRMAEEQLVIPTYGVGAAERNPIFYTGRSYQGAKGPVYPYPLLDQLSDQKQDQTYRAVYLENPYVQYVILPELGGRIFSGRDQTNGYDFVYHQHVVKPALIGMVGAWISGGVEWNIPHHHRASTFMPVDSTLVENPDGSKTVWVGEIERRHRMKWLVGMTLYPDRSYLQVTVKLFNRTPLPHSLLYFANVAVHANEQYQVLFPPRTEYGTQHGKREFVTWPIGHGFYGGRDRTGVDLSWWKNLPTPASIFCWNYEEDFFGGYDHGRRAGLAILADHHTAPGKKFFEWGNGSEGRMWERLLTDADGPYLELMAGGYSDNQPDYSWIQPGETKVVAQYFYPLRELGGLKNANFDGAVNLDAAAGKARLAFNATAEHRAARAVLTAGGNALFEQTIAIGPAQPFVREVPLPAGVAVTDLKASLFDADGRELVSYQPAPPANRPMPPRVIPPPAPRDVKTTDELYLAGQRLEQFYSPALEPYPYYEEILQRDPGDYRANLALGILYAKRGQFARAQERLSAAVQRATANHTSPQDGAAFYYLGVVRAMQGQDAAAEEALHHATWSVAWAPASHYALAEAACRRGDFGAALRLLDRALAGDAANPKALDLKAAVLRRLGRAAEAEPLFAQVLQIDPLDFWARNERYLRRRGRGDEGPARAELAALMRGEVQSYLELALDYTHGGFWDEAIDVLNRYVAAAPDPGQVYPMAHYYLGWLWRQKGDSAQADAHDALAAKLPADYCFPFRLEALAVLQQAAQRHPADARAPYYLGNLLFDLQPEAAIAAWEQARARDGRFATVHRNLGLAYHQVEHNAAKAAASLEQALACDPNDPKLYAELDALSEAAGADPRARLARLEAHQAVVAQRDDALRREVGLQVFLGAYDRALATLEHHHFRLWEGESGLHDLYADAHVLRGMAACGAGRYDAARQDFEAALRYPDNLETGKPDAAGGRAAQVQYLLGTVYEATGQAGPAQAAYEQAARGGADGTDAPYYQGLAHRKLGHTEQAARILDDLVRAATQRLEQGESADFFAKFGTRQSGAWRRAQAHYLVGLGRLGQGDRTAAKAAFEAALAGNVCHAGARAMLAALGAAR